MTTKAEVQTHRKHGSWRHLEALAAELVKDASEQAGMPMQPLLGGGTRLMLAMEHRISHDIDLFIRDPQWLGFLTPRLNDKFEGRFTNYDEGATSLKLRTEGGEIDFIVAMSLVGHPSERVDDCVFDLEPVAEVLAKKLFYRGWALTPRDLYDWWCIETGGHLEDKSRALISELIAPKAELINEALRALPLSQKAGTAWRSILAPDLPPLEVPLAWAKKRMQDIRPGTKANPSAPPSLGGGALFPQRSPTEEQAARAKTDNANPEPRVPKV